MLSVLTRPLPFVVVLTSSSRVEIENIIWTEDGERRIQLLRTPKVLTGIFESDSAEFASPPAEALQNLPVAADWTDVIFRGFGLKRLYVLEIRSLSTVDRCSSALAADSDLSLFSFPRCFSAPVFPAATVSASSFSFSFFLFTPLRAPVSNTTQS